MSITILGFCTHENNIAFAAGGFILKSIHQGHQVVIVSISKGMPKPHLANDLAFKPNMLFDQVKSESLHLEQCVLENCTVNRLKIIQIIRKHKPKIILANAIKSCHPDRSKISKLISESSFLSGLSEVITLEGVIKQQSWKPEAVYHYIQNNFTEPDVVVDISAFFEEKLSKIHDVVFSTKTEDADGLSSSDLLQQIESVNRHYGATINVAYAEAFTTQRFSLFKLLQLP